MIIKTLGKHLEGFKLVSVLTPLFVMVEVVTELLLTRLVASLIDKGINVGNIRHIFFIGGLMLLVAAISLVSGIMSGRCGAKASTGFARNLRKAMFEHVQTFSFANIDKFSTAGLVTRLTTDVTNIQNAYMMILRMCFRAPLMLILAMVMAFSINRRIATIYLIAVIILGIALSGVVMNAMKYFSQVFRKYDDLNASVQENVTGIRVVKAYVRENYENEKFTRASGNLYKMFVRAEKIVALNGPFMQTTVYTCIMLISWVGAKMIVSNTLTTGDLTSLLSYCMQILGGLMMMSMVFVMISMSVASMERVAEVLNESSTITNPKNPVMEVEDGSIRFDHVFFSYRQGGGEPVLQDIDLKIESGQTIGIMGGTGSSKSSLVNLISRLYDVTEGAVYVGGRDVREYDLDTLRNDVAVVLQKNVLFSGTILDNLRWGNPDATEEECIEACKLACADDFIRSFPDGYHTHIEQGGSNVSGGQKQRLCIARALLKKPKILILDDSTSAVDTATDARIREALAKAIPGTTKLIIAQRVSSVEHADKIILINEGKIDGFASHEELMVTDPIYKDLYESQTGVGGDFDEKGGEL